MDERGFKRYGSLVVITGPMFSGKTEELLRRIHLSNHAQKGHLVFKPQIDNRYSKSKVVSHWGRSNEAEAIIVRSSKEIKDYLNNKINLLFFDEIQFFDEEIVSTLDDLVRKGYKVTATGLDKNFRGEPFNEIMKGLLIIADSVIKLTAVCSVCKEDASFTQRIIEGQPARYHDPLILVGSVEKYEARCRHCHICLK